ncbi:MAG: CvpA family protein [Chloroflexota bacterium]
MISLPFALGLFVFLFAIIGAMRGWAKEMLVTFSVILALFIITVTERYVPFVRESLSQPGTSSQFWTRSLILMVLVYFGYQTPRLQLIPMTKFIREKMRDSILGLILGGINGYLIVGTIWYYLNEAHYPFPQVIAPVMGDPVGDFALKLLTYMPPRLMGVPMVYFSIALGFVMIIIIFV